MSYIPRPPRSAEEKQAAAGRADEIRSLLSNRSGSVFSTERAGTIKLPSSTRASIVRVMDSDAPLPGLPPMPVIDTPTAGGGTVPALVGSPLPGMHRRAASAGDDLRNMRQSHPESDFARPPSSEKQPPAVDLAAAGRTPPRPKSRRGLTSLRVVWPHGKGRSAKGSDVESTASTRPRWKAGEMNQLASAALRSWRSGQPADRGAVGDDLGRSIQDVGQMLEHMLEGYVRFGGVPSWESQSTPFILRWAAVEFPENPTLSPHHPAPRRRASTATSRLEACLSVLSCKSRPSSHSLFDAPDTPDVMPSAEEAHTPDFRERLRSGDYFSESQSVPPLPQRFGTGPRDRDRDAGTFMASNSVVQQRSRPKSIASVRDASTQSNAASSSRGTSAAAGGLQNRPTLNTMSRETRARRSRKGPLSPSSAAALSTASSPSSVAPAPLRFSSQATPLDLASQTSSQPRAGVVLGGNAESQATPAVSVTDSSTQSLNTLAMAELGDDDLDSAFDDLGAEMRHKARRLVWRYIRTNPVEIQRRVEAWGREEEALFKPAHMYWGFTFDNDAIIKAAEEVARRDDDSHINTYNLAFNLKMVYECQKKGIPTTGASWNRLNEYATSLMNRRILGAGPARLREHRDKASHANASEASVHTTQASMEQQDVLKSVTDAEGDEQMSSFERTLFWNEVAVTHADFEQETHDKGFKDRREKYGPRPIPVALQVDRARMLEFDVAIYDELIWEIWIDIPLGKRVSREIIFLRALELINEGIAYSCGFYEKNMSQIMNDTNDDGLPDDSTELTGPESVKKIPSGQSAIVVGRAFARSYFPQAKRGFLLAMIHDHPFRPITRDEVVQWISYGASPFGKNADYLLNEALYKYLQSLNLRPNRKKWLQVSAAATLSMLRRAANATTEKKHISHIDLGLYESSFAEIVQLPDGGTGGASLETCLVQGVTGQKSAFEDTPEWVGGLEDSRANLALVSGAAHGPEEELAYHAGSGSGGAIDSPDNSFGSQESQKSNAWLTNSVNRNGLDSRLADMAVSLGEPQPRANGGGRSMAQRRHTNPVSSMPLTAGTTSTEPVLTLAPQQPSGNPLVASQGPDVNYAGLYAHQLALAQVQQRESPIPGGIQPMPMPQMYSAFLPPGEQRHNSLPLPYGMPTGTAGPAVQNGGAHSSEGETVTLSAQKVDQIYSMLYMLTLNQTPLEPAASSTPARRRSLPGGAETLSSGGATGTRVAGQRQYKAVRNTKPRARGAAPSIVQLEARASEHAQRRSGRRKSLGEAGGRSLAGPTPVQMPIRPHTQSATTERRRRETGDRPDSSSSSNASRHVRYERSTGMFSGLGCISSDQEVVEVRRWSADETAYLAREAARFWGIGRRVDTRLVGFEMDRTPREVQLMLKLMLYEYILNEQERFWSAADRSHIAAWAAAEFPRCSVLGSQVPVHRSPARTTMLNRCLALLRCRVLPDEPVPRTAGKAPAPISANMRSSRPARDRSPQRPGSSPAAHDQMEESEYELVHVPDNQDIRSQPKHTRDAAVNTSVILFMPPVSEPLATRSKTHEQARQSLTKRMQNRRERVSYGRSPAVSVVPTPEPRRKPPPRPVSAGPTLKAPPTASADEPPGHSVAQRPAVSYDSDLLKLPPVLCSKHCDDQECELSPNQSTESIGLSRLDGDIDVHFTAVAKELRRSICGFVEGYIEQFFDTFYYRIATPQSLERRCSSLEREDFVALLNPSIVARIERTMTVFDTVQLFLSQGQQPPLLQHPDMGLASLHFHLRFLRAARKWNINMESANWRITNRYATAVFNRAIEDAHFLMFEDHRGPSQAAGARGGSPPSYVRTQHMILRNDAYRREYYIGLVAGLLTTRYIQTFGRDTLEKRAETYGYKPMPIKMFREDLPEPELRPEYHLGYTGEMIRTVLYKLVMSMLPWTTRLSKSMAMRRSIEVYNKAVINCADKTLQMIDCAFRDQPIGRQEAAADARVQSRTTPMSLAEVRRLSHSLADLWVDGFKHQALKALMMKQQIRPVCLTEIRRWISEGRAPAGQTFGYLLNKRLYDYFKHMHLPLCATKWVFASATATLWTIAKVKGAATSKLVDHVDVVEHADRFHEYVLAISRPRPRPTAGLTPATAVTSGPSAVSEAAAAPVVPAATQAHMVPRRAVEARVTAVPEMSATAQVSEAAAMPKAAAVPEAPAGPKTIAEAIAAPEAAAVPEAPAGPKTIAEVPIGPEAGATPSGSRPAPQQSEAAPGPGPGNLEKAAQHAAPAALGFEDRLATMETTIKKMNGQIEMMVGILQAPSS
ncbi:hypothetical protein GGF46_005427 [Coemansia sp. RSA 552]|nr:hypothetical protein GGF46_005427 [Coemansia sp. RSA 552]